MSRIERLGALALTVFAAAAPSGCSLEPLPDVPRCGPLRRTSDGSCCPVFTRATDGGCVDRPVEELAPLGGAGAASLSIAVDGAGRALVGWTAESTVFVAEEAQSGALATRSDLAAGAAGAALQIDVAAGPDGEALVAWRTNGVPAPDDSRIHYASRSAGGQWTPAGAQVSFGSTSYEPRVAIGPDGDAVLLWNQWYDDAHYGVAFATTRAVGEPFRLPSSASDVLSPPVFFSNGPRVALGADGRALVTWYQATEQLMTYVSERSSRDEEMSRPGGDEFISAPGAPVDSHPISNPKPALGPSGQAAVVWTQEDGRGHVDTYLATRDAAGRWYPPRDLDDALSGHDGYARCAELAFGSQGDLFVVYQHDSAAMLSVRGVDGSWLTPRGLPKRLSADGVIGLDPHVAAGANGGIAIVFHELDGDVSRLRVLELVSGAPDLDRRAEVVATGVGFDAPLVAVGGPDDRALFAVVERGVTPARVRVLSQ
jgi:hypothetical protein